MYNSSFWNFVDENIGASASALRLKYHGKDLGFDIEFALLQIECRQKFHKKLSQTLSRIPRFIFPTRLSGEQATSDILADFHASLIKDANTIVDLTCGLGIDALHLSEHCISLNAIDNEECKINALMHNSLVAKHNNIKCICSDAKDYLTTMSGHCDVAFIDPARRKDDGSRAYGLADCSPDLIELQELTSSKCDRLIAKCSPMLDITQLSRELRCIKQIYAVGNTTECKELVAVADYKHPATALTISAICLGASMKEYHFTMAQEQEAAAQVKYGLPQAGDYLYVPYPAVMKAAPFNLLATQYELKKLHANTHLYYSDIVVSDFPGQIFPIIDVLPYQSKHIKRLKAQYPAISVATRNFDVSADALRQKLGVKDGGNHRLFAATCQGNDKIMIITGSAL